MSEPTPTTGAVPAAPPAGVVPAAPPAGAAPGPALVRLSPAQESMWLEQQLHPSAINGGFLSVLLRGDVTAEQVRAACLIVCDDHPQLRGLVVTHEPDGSETGGSGARMAIHPASAVLQFEELPLPAAPGGELETARRWYRENRVGPWDLTVRSPIAFSLLDHGEQRCTLVVGVHHIAFDGRSKFVFARQFLSALAALRTAAGPPERQRQDLPEHPEIDQELDEVLQHWLAADLLTLPGLVLPRGDGADPGEEVRPTPRFDLPAEHCARLRTLTKEAGASFFTGLVACLAAVLSEYGNSRFVVGIPVDTSVPRTRDQIGLQINVVPCLIEVERDASFRDLLAISARALGLVHRYRRVPFGWVLRELRRRHGVDVSQGAFDRIGVSYPTVVRDVGEVPGLECDWDFFAPNSTRSFEVILQLRREGDAAYGRLDFTAASLDPAGAIRLTADFTRLLGQLTERPDTPLGLLAQGYVRAASTGRDASPSPGDGGGVRGSFAELTAVAAGPDASRVARCPVEQFLPTPAVAAFSRAGGRVLLDVVDPALGRLGGCAWRADDPYGIWLTDPAPGLRFQVTDPAGRALPPGIPGLLGLADDPRPGALRAWIDAADRIRLLGPVDLAHGWAGRLLDRADAEAVIAALPGVREAAVLWEPRAGDAVPRVSAVVVPVAGADAGADADRRLWRRTVRRAWPSGWPQPAVHVLDCLPRTPSGTVDRASLGTTLSTALRG
ncbi:MULTISPECIES: condensation domain-containing protein [unclassified Streptomyces]|uniref:condensation domain-containing protein n=1 Tax=unclassified Streptomyces TaxID=2593676 RepID=UPI002E81D7A8|nr:condensation domain-containing protein [Streptomyces sp. NBC_00589]WTI39684.1 condensation domain-containing protein [Streptomyces sp. NBC_00775]WUB26637.1 condensation domain-containing protein [Streptomyces sp. NBC_00589]